MASSDVGPRCLRRSLQGESEIFRNSRRWGLPESQKSIGLAALQKLTEPVRAAELLHEISRLTAGLRSRP